ncbi:hypothetical protein J5N97_020878 [Dioscorea zingiberensis]|uniref:Protein root UVB sensitive/RUS domain-containing protein n=1 Tax=Dioscorea zingiberensis TaxID=325984 RepID=A0A9D5HDT6_9LILI|nr:hypothetical protein J5N97_020878 [Dioscorea zingiberensis]
MPCVRHPSFLAFCFLRRHGRAESLPAELRFGPAMDGFARWMERLQGSPLLQRKLVAGMELCGGDGADLGRSSERVVGEGCSYAEPWASLLIVCKEIDRISNLTIIVLSLKNVAAVTSTSTRTFIYKAYARGENIGDVTAKGESVGNIAESGY